MGRFQSKIVFATFAGLIGALLVRGGFSDERDAAEKAKDAKAGSVEESSDAAARDIPRVSVEVARDRAMLLHEVYLSTLDVIHHRYFHAEKTVIPARAMEDIFKDMQRTSHIKARWIAVNLKPMGVDHEPESDFEKHSVRKIKGGERTVEAIDGGYYRRTVAIPLTGKCIACHDAFREAESPSSKFAGLVISVPVRHGETLPAGKDTSGTAGRPSR